MGVCTGRHARSLHQSNWEGGMIALTQEIPNTYSSSRGTFTPTRSNNPCPICDNTSGKCRTTDTKIVLCMTFADAFNQANAPDYKYLHTTKDGLWGVYVPEADRNYSDAEREQWKRQREAIKAQRVSEEQQQYSKRLDAIARDREYRKLLDQLTLSHTDRKDLVKRGLTAEQIERGMFRTIGTNQKLARSVDPQLPGINADGRSLNVSSYGYLIPIPDVEGHLIGSQERKRNSDSGRYRWLTSISKKRSDGSTPHLPNGELPLGVYRPPQPQSLAYVGLAEGFLKPFIAAERLGITFLGADAGNFGSRPGQLKLTLQKLEQEIGERPALVLYADAGAIANPNVRKIYTRTYKLCKQLGYELQIAWWGQFSKQSHNDIDELPNLTSWDDPRIKFISWQEYLDLQAHLLVEPDLRLNQRYLDDLNVPNGTKLLCLKSPKGTGKTEAIARLVQQRYLYNMPILVLGHRKQLVQALCDRFSIRSVYELNDDTGNLIGYGLCVDSVHGESQARFNADEWSDALVIIDESEQVIWHTLNAGTDVRSYRLEVLEQMQRLFANVLSSEEGMIVLSDADLTNQSIDFVLGMANHRDIKPYVIVNDYRFEESWNVYLYRDSTPAKWYASLERQIANAKRVLVHLDSQKVTGNWSATNLASRLRSQFPELKILVLDSETIADSNHPAFQAIAHGLDSLIANYDVVIATPVVETGLSIDLKGHFNCVFAALFGVTGDTQSRQAMARLREPVDRHIWCKSYGLGTEGGGETNPAAIVRSQVKSIQRQIRQLQDFALGNIDVNPHPIALTVWATMAARHNSGVIKFRESVERGLIAEGHRVIEAPDDDSTDLAQLSKEMRENRDANYLAEREAIERSQNLDEFTAAKLKQQRAKTKTESRQLRKYQLQKRYGIPVTPELIEADDDGLYAKFKLHYYFTIGREFLSDREKAKLAQLCKDSQKLWAPDANRTLLTAKIALLDELGVVELLNSDREYRGTDDDIVRLADKVIDKRFAVKSVLGCTVKYNDSPIRVAQRLLGSLGLNLIKTGRDKVKGKAGARVYKFLGNDVLRTQVFEAWLARDDGRLNSADATQVGFEAIADPLPIDPLVANRSSIPDSGSLLAGNNHPPEPLCSLAKNKLKQGMQVFWHGVVWTIATLGTATAKLIKVTSEWEDWCFDLDELSIAAPG